MLDLWKAMNGSTLIISIGSASITSDNWKGYAQHLCRVQAAARRRHQYRISEKEQLTALNMGDAADRVSGEKAPRGDIIPEWWATSNRNGGRHHSGMVGDIEPPAAGGYL